MKRLFDVVNFNADASCLSAGRWLSLLQGGEGSALTDWLRLYVDFGKKVIIGFTGATIADISSRNPEAIDLINRHPEIFEIILRPFSHDIALTRIGNGFSLNFEYGRKAILKEFGNIRNFFLPPEFMLTNQQIAELKENGVEGIFINPSRFSTELGKRIPVFPYTIRGLFGSSIGCISFRGKLTDRYLEAIHKFDCGGWNNGVFSEQEENLFSWRDGESSFLLPAGLARESFWLGNEDPAIERAHLKGARISFTPNEDLEGSQYKTYPVHPFSAWMKEFRMLGFINRIRRIEESLDDLTEEQVHLWLMVINSDILSAIEKKSPVVSLRDAPDGQPPHDFRIHRSERGFEGEEYLALLEMVISGKEPPARSLLSDEPHMIKMKTRTCYLNELSRR